MKRKQKGFTLVELLVVIAILAVLATVSILGYSSFTRKATISNDEAVAAQINLVLQANEAEGKPNTLYEALQLVFDAGYDVTKLTPTTAGYNYVYHKDTNRFELVEKLENAKASDWIFVDAKDAENKGYSVYLVSNNENKTELNVNAGIDVGEQTITTINYTNTASAQDVVIRTNGGTLTVNDTNNASHQYHYGYASSVTVATGSACYECHAIITNMTINAGKAIADEGAYVGVVEANADVKLEENGGIFVIPAGVAAVKVPAVVAEQIGYTNDGTTIAATAEKAAKAEKANEEANTKLNEEVSKNESNVVRIGAVGYDDFQDAIDAANNGDTVYLLKSININNSQILVEDKNITIDGLNNKITVSCDSAYATEQNNYTYGLNIVGNTKNTIVDVKNLTINAIGAVRYALCFNGDDDGKYCASGNVYDCTVSCSFVGIGVSGNDYGDSDVKLYNCNISHVKPDTTPNGWLNTAVAPQFDGRVTINGGTYVSSKYCVYIFSSGGIATIEGGTFTANEIVLKSQFTSSYSNVHEKSEIIVNGGTFNGNIDSCNGTTETITIYGNAVVNGTIGNGVADKRSK